jgi:probable rRNA maturation factor
MSIIVDIEDAGWNSLSDLEDRARAAISSVLPLEKQGHGLVILFTSDAEIQTLNREWRGKDRPTNVLSFPAPQDVLVPPDEETPLGDLALGYGIIVKEAKAQNKTVLNHTLHLIVHGTLHLLGYDHETEAEALTMEATEIAALAKLGIANPYQL